MEEILDQEINVNQPDETKINRIASIARFGICAVTLYYLCYELYFDFLTGMFFWPAFLPRLLGIWLIYHNFVIGREEWRSKYVTNVTDFISTGFALLLYLSLIYRLAGPTIPYILDGVMHYMFIYDAVLIAAYMFIGSREIVYLMRDRRLKRLKNQ